MQRTIVFFVLIAIALPLSAQDKEKRTGSHIPQVETVRVISTASDGRSDAPSRAQRRALSELPALPVETTSDDESEAQDPARPAAH